MRPQREGVTIALVCLIAASTAGRTRAGSYSYDALGRVITATSDNGAHTTYVYDAAGNRTTVSTASGSATAPVALPNAYSFTYGSPPFSADPRNNDTPAGWPIRSGTPPQFGSVVFQPGYFTYTPSGNRPVGQDVFTYTTEETPGGRTASAVVTVQLSFAPPVTQPDALNFIFGGPAVTIDPRANDSDPAGLALTITGVTQPGQGSASFATGSVTYTGPGGHTEGSTSFGYAIQNSVGRTASNVVNVTLVNSTPVAYPDTLTVPYGSAGSLDPTLNDTNVSGGPLSVTSVSAAAHGTTSRSANTVTYAAASGYSGSDSFTYGVSAYGHGATGTVNVTVSSAPPAQLTATVSTTSWMQTQCAAQPAQPDPPVAAAGAGGSPGYTYAWQRLSGDTSTSATSGASASTQFTRSPLPTANSMTWTSTWKAVVTDTVGHTADTPPVSVTIQYLKLCS